MTCDDLIGAYVRRASYMVTVPSKLGQAVNELTDPRRRVLSTWALEEHECVENATELLRLGASPALPLSPTSVGGPVAEDSQE